MILRNAIQILSGSAFLACAMLCASVGWAQIDAGTVAITHVDVIPMTGNTLLHDQTVVIQGGNISEIGPAGEVDIPRQSAVIDAEGLYLMPGLADFHTHIRDSGELINYLAWGVTTVMHLGGSGESGIQIREFRDSVKAGELMAPHIYTTNRILDGDPALPRSAISLTDPVAARQAVRDLSAGNFDFVKIYNNVSRPVFDAIVAEAQAQDLAVVGHIPRAFDARQSLGAGQSVIAHSEELFFTYFGGPRRTDDFPDAWQPDLGLLPELIDILLRNEVAVMPDLSFEFTNQVMWDSLDLVWSDPEFEYLHPDTASLWASGNINRRANIENFMLRGRWKYELMLYLAAEFRDAGVLQVIGTDASLPGLYPGKAAQRELTELVKAGFSSYEALEVGTSNAGTFIRRYLDDQARVGQVAEGYRADLVLLRDNPLSDVRNARLVDAVIVNGRVFDSTMLNASRDALRREYRSLPGVN